MQRTESTRYAILTGIKVATDSVKIIDEADQVKTSICPGISITNKQLPDC